MGSTDPRNSSLSGFRRKLLLAMMLVVFAVTSASLLFAQRYLASSAGLEFQREFQGELASLHAVQELRDAALAERCRALARRPRIHAALEDGAPDLLYPSARDEMLGARDREDAVAGDSGEFALHARYYRFLDKNGRVIPPTDPSDAGELPRSVESQLDLGGLPGRRQTGYVIKDPSGATQAVDEMIAMPIVSTENGEVISAIVLGFRSPGTEQATANAAIRSGVLVGNRLTLPSLGEGARAALAREVSRAIDKDPNEGSFEARADGEPYMLFYKLLNPGSLYPAAYEVSIFPLAALLHRQRMLIWQIAAAGALLMLAAFAASHRISIRLSGPVERLAVDSIENLTQRDRARAALEMKSEELQRAARFSADASHQLKTPVTVLRAGLEELLAAEDISPQARQEVSALVHQTFRLASVIEDLLLLSRMDAKRLKIQFGRLDLTAMIEGLIDDLGALPEASNLKINAVFPPSLWVSGERRYTALILQNLLENARKYNRPGGRIKICARREGEWALIAIGNTGTAIPGPAQEHIFERFHRGVMGENVPGHGIGLNLASELAHLHGGDLRLVQSVDDWTEFELRFRLAGETGDMLVPE